MLLYDHNDHCTYSHGRVHDQMLLCIFDDMLEFVLTAFLAFISTNIDDLFILTILFSQTSSSFTKKHIITGQYLGIITLIVLSLAGSFLKFFIPLPYIGLLGILPIVLGCRKLLARESDEDSLASPEVRRGHILQTPALGVAALTIANGGDNIGIYVPLFAALSPTSLVTTIVIFLAMVYVWVFIADWLGSHRYLKNRIKKYSHYILPIVLIALGFYIFHESGTINLVLDLFTRASKT